MPSYSYKCVKCETEFDVFYRSIPAAEVEEPDEACPKCDSKEKERLVAPTGGFILRGSGWAKDRYGGRGK